MDVRTSSTATPDMIDAVMDGYVIWREHSAAVELAYQRWRTAPSDTSRIAFDDYVEALDREEDAAELFRLVIEQASRRL